MKPRDPRLPRVPRSFWLVLLAFAFAVAACSHEVPKGTDPQFALIGYSKAQLIACAGKPVTTTETAGLEYLVYHSETVLHEGYFQNTPRIPGVGSLALGSKGDRFSCEAIFTVRDGVVEATTLRADPPQDGKTTADLCAPIVAHCSSP